MTQPVALITGTSSGIGRATASTLASHGFHVFGTSRSPEADDPSRPYVLVALDVRSEASVRAAVEEVLNQAGRIDLLVNNAGYGQSGAIEEVSTADANSQFETNVFGIVRMIQAVVPTMRRQGGGRIINISSVLGYIAPPFLGLYAASKFALEGITEALRAELRPFGIEVSVVEPGFVKSNFVVQRPTDPLPEYDVARGAATAFARKEFEAGLNPEAVAEVILRVGTSPSPRLRYPVGRASSTLIALKRFLPEPVFESLSRRIFQAEAMGSAQ